MCLVLVLALRAHLRTEVQRRPVSESRDLAERPRGASAGTFGEPGESSETTPQRPSNREALLDWVFSVGGKVSVAPPSRRYTMDVLEEDWHGSRANLPPGKITSVAAPETSVAEWLARLPPDAHFAHLFLDRPWGTETYYDLDGCLRIVGSMPFLKGLSIFHSRVTGRGVSHLAALRVLQGQIRFHPPIDAVGRC